MNRVLIVLILLPTMITISIFSMVRVHNAKDRITMLTQEVIDRIEAGDKDGALKSANAVTDYWKNEGKILTHYTRHNLIETLSLSIARLPPLVEFDDKPALHAEIMAIRWQMENVYRSEAFELRNIL